MSDSRDRGGNPPVDSNAFQEWVKHTAESRGVDEQELLNQLVSAFWILDEMNGITDGDDMLHDTESLYPPNVPDSDQQTSPHGDTEWEEVAGQSDAGTDPERQDGSEGLSEPGPDSRDQDDAETNDRPEEPEANSIADEIQILQESMYGQLEMVQTVADLRRQVSDLSLDVEQQRSRQDQFTDRISDDLTRLHSRVETLDNQIDETSGVDEAELDQLSAELTAEIDQLESTQHEFEAWVDEEFDEIEELFKHLLDRIDAFDERINALDADVATLRDDSTGDDRLATLRRDALDLGIDTGRCEGCESVIDLSMLNEPICPDCGATFSSVEPATRWNPFAKSLIRTANDPE